MSEVFEIIVFTASHSCYANVVLNILDPENKYITFRLFRDHCLQTKEGIFIKDLRIIANRKQENIAIVDNATYSFGFQLDNGIPIVPFYDNEKDKELLHLMSFLYKMNGQQDVRLFNRQHFEYDFLNQNCHDYDFLAENLKNGSSPVNGNIG